MPANTSINYGGTCLFYCLRQLDRFVKGSTIFHQVEHRQPKDNNKVITGTLAYRPNNLHSKTHAIGIIASPFVITLVGAQCQEFVDQIPFRTHHFYAVITCFPRQLCAVSKILNQL